MLMYMLKTLLAIVLLYSSFIQNSKIPSCIYTYIGCYKDGYDRTLQHTSAIWQDSLTNNWCIYTCHSKAYLYAGTEYGKECHCGNDNDRFNKRPEPECSIPCSGNNTEMCGGSWRLSIYKIDNCTDYTDETITSTEIDKITSTAIGQTAIDEYSRLKIKDSTPQAVDKAMCSCPCQSMDRSTSVSEIDEVVAKIKRELRIDKKNLSSYKRSKSSQTDTRALSMCIGIVGGTVISIPIISIIICDVINMLNRK